MTGRFGGRSPPGCAAPPPLYSPYPRYPCNVPPALPRAGSGVSQASASHLPTPPSPLLFTRTLIFGANTDAPTGSLDLHLFSPHTPSPHRTHRTRTHTLMPTRLHTRYTHTHTHTHLIRTPYTHLTHTPSTGDEKDEDKDDYRGRFDQAAVRAPPRATRHSYPPEARPECEQGREEEVAASFEKDQRDPKQRDELELSVGTSVKMNETGQCGLCRLCRLCRLCGRGTPVAPVCVPAQTSSGKAPFGFFFFDMYQIKFTSLHFFSQTLQTSTIHKHRTRTLLRTTKTANPQREDV